MNFSRTIDVSSRDKSFSLLINKVFLWMSIGLAITASVSYVFASTPTLLYLLINETGFTFLGYVVTFAPIGFVLLMSLGFNRMSYEMLLGLFVVYAAIMGASLSFIFVIYTSQSIFSVFIITSFMFGGMALWGYLTKADLSKMGSIMMMALFGVIIASLVNMFMKSAMMSYVISIISVVVFCGLTAWDIQKIKTLQEDTSVDEASKAKMAILGALTLYLDFINLFLSLLRLLGNRRND